MRASHGFKVKEINLLVKQLVVDKSNAFFHFIIAKQDNKN